MYLWLQICLKLGEDICNFCLGYERDSTILLPSDMGIIMLSQGTPFDQPL